MLAHNAKQKCPAKKIGGTHGFGGKQSVFEAHKFEGTKRFFRIVHAYRLSQLHLYNAYRFLPRAEPSRSRRRHPGRDGERRTRLGVPVRSAEAGTDLQQSLRLRKHDALWRM